MIENEKYYHIPVLSQEVCNYLITDRGGIYVDATVGTGGHAKKILENLSQEGRLIGIDWDPEMIHISSNTLAEFKKRVTLVGGNFANIDEILRKLGINYVSGLLLDLGISSLHFDKASRGFSFSHDGPLDMRINPANPLTAHSIINTWPYEQIEHLIRVCGEKFSSRIARAILNYREKKEIKTTTELRKIIEKVLPNKYKLKRRSHPATKTFLALRVAVNYEFENLTRVLQKSIQILAPGARICIITFHSLEDRIVKETFRFMSKMGGWKLITKKPVTPKEEEIKNNPRARSAKLRVIEKIK